jgi:hypothetical protein
MAENNSANITKTNLARKRANAYRDRSVPIARDYSNSAVFHVIVFIVYIVVIDYVKLSAARAFTTVRAQVRRSTTPISRCIGCVFERARRTVESAATSLE